MSPATPTPRRFGRRALGAGVLIACASTLAACGAAAKVPPTLPRAQMQEQLDASLLPTTPGPASPTSPSITKDAEVPKAVAALERAAGTVLPGEPAQALSIFDAQIKALRGTPVVVNLWGDWCAPCQKEIPVFQRVALAERGRVAFLGVGTFSKRPDLEKYLATKKWLPYPTILDNDGKVVGTTHVSNVPQTIYYSASGKRFVHLGPYTSVADLEADIKRYTA